MEAPISRELRWFLSGPVPAEAWDWFNGLPGKKSKTSFPRKDIYLVVPRHEDLGLKVREGRLEIKIRTTRHKLHVVTKGSIAGFPEDWTKDTWDYADPIGDISTPFKKGTRVRVIKSRSQRKYAVSRNGLSPVPVAKRPDRAFLIELTELFSEAVDKKDERSAPRRDWTIACEAICHQNHVAEAFELGTRKLLEPYRGPALSKKHSYGYPRFALNVADAL